MLLQRLLVYRAAPSPLGSGLAGALGHPPDAKLLVVNCDDVAAHPAFVDGVFAVMEAGIVRSASVTVHDRNDADLARVAARAAREPGWGVGVHLSLTNEFQHHHPWAPVLPRDEVPTLYNPEGRMWQTIAEVEAHVDPREAERELEAQVRKALRIGIRPSHLDSHMGTVYRDSRFPGAPRDGLRDAAIAVARRFDLPLTMHTFDRGCARAIRSLDAHGSIRPDMLFGFYSLEEMNTHLDYRGPAARRAVTAWTVRRAFGFELPYENQAAVEHDAPVRAGIVRQAIRALVRPGLSHLFMHAASPEGPGGEAIPRSLGNAGGVDEVARVADALVWSDPALRDFLDAEGVVLTSYAELRARTPAGG